MHLDPLSGQLPGKARCRAQAVAHEGRADPVTVIDDHRKRELAAPGAGRAQAFDDEVPAAGASSDLYSAPATLRNRVVRDRNFTGAPPSADNLSHVDFA
ncbi:hypothetical protein GCM10023209_04710 [Roseibacterium beibuensis]|uniref:Uncharacterized protein n=1 Tax=[Roseibacterium] beibuensis TaxID=1193142 RepID=A0ABP9KVX0_9RHOB